MLKYCNRWWFVNLYRTMMIFSGWSLTFVSLLTMELQELHLPSSWSASLSSNVLHMNKARSCNDKQLNHACRLIFDFSCALSITLFSLLLKPCCCKVHEGGKVLCRLSWTSWPWGGIFHRIHGKCTKCGCYFKKRMRPEQAACKDILW